MKCGWRAAACFVAVALSAGCASSGASGRQPSRLGSSTVLTDVEITRTTAQDALRAIELARPAWLVARASGLSGSRDRIQAYVEGVHYSDLNDLRNVSVAMVREIRFLDAREATTRFGTGHGAGAIVVLLKQ